MKTNNTIISIQSYEYFNKLVSMPLTKKEKVELQKDIQKLKDLVKIINKKEKQCIVCCLKKNNNNKAKTSSELGISRVTLYRKIKKYNINLKKNI